MEAELKVLLARVSADREEVERLLGECGGDAALQDRMAGLYLEVEERRQALEAARRAARPVRGGLAGMFATLFGEPAQPAPEPVTPAVEGARAAMTRSEADLESVNAQFRALRALREALRGRLDVLGDSLGRWQPWDAAALRRRFLSLADATGWAAFRAEFPGQLYVELLAHAGRHLESLKQSAAQVDTVMRMVETAAATHSGVALPGLGGTGVGRAMAGREAAAQSLREALHRIQTKTFPDLQAAVARAEQGLALLGVPRPQPTDPTEGDGAAGPAGASVEAEVHRMRWRLVGFGRDVQAFRLAADAEIKTLWAHRDRLAGGAAAGTAAVPAQPAAPVAARTTATVEAPAAAEGMAATGPMPAMTATPAQPAAPATPAPPATPEAAPAPAKPTDAAQTPPPAPLPPPAPAPPPPPVPDAAKDSPLLEWGDPEM